MEKDCSLLKEPKKCNHIQNVSLDWVLESTCYLKATGAHGGPKFASVEYWLFWIKVNWKTTGGEKIIKKKKKNSNTSFPP